MNQWIDEIPPTTQPTRYNFFFNNIKIMILFRFGNKAFRTWYLKLDNVKKNF